MARLQEDYLSDDRSNTASIISHTVLSTGVIRACSARGARPTGTRASTKPRSGVRVVDCRASSRDLSRVCGRSDCFFFVVSAPIAFVTREIFARIVS